MDFAHIPPSFLFNCTAQGTPQEVELKFTLNVSFKANDSMNNSASTQHNTRGMEDIQLLVCGEKNSFATSRPPDFFSCPFCRQDVFSVVLS